MVDKRLENAIQFIKQSDKRNAGLLLQEIVKENPNDESAWLYLAFCVAKVEQKRYCLKKVLEINPNNVQARKAIQELQIEVPQANSVASPRNVISRSEKKVEKDTPKNNKNLTQILLAGSLFLFSLSVCVVVTFWVMSQRNSPNISIIPPVTISTPIDSQSGTEQAILGVWRDTKVIANPEFVGTTVEFLEDGTLIMTKSWKTSKEVYVGDYEIIEKNRIRVSVSSIPAIILMIDSIDSKYLLISSDQDLGEYLCCGSTYILGFSYRFEKQD
ncbi:MAG: hypothetical protein KJZ77_15780 [Anaerolineales bacterium]|nr:hypothetical protein [Anaerolineales bacterium]